MDIAPSEEQNEVLDPKKARIVIVDDEEGITDVSKGILEMRGYSRVSTHNDPVEALEDISKQLKDQGVLPDLVMSDVNMSGMDGPDLLRSIKGLAEANNKTVPGFVIMSGLPGQITPEIIKELDLESVVQKPFPNFKELGTTVINPALKSHWEKTS